MADLVLPPDVEITSLPIGPWYPGLIPSEGEYTGRLTYLSTAPASWRGSVEFGVTDTGMEAVGAKLNSILAAMQGGQKTLALPMPGPTIVEPSVATTVQSIDNAGVLTLSQALSTAPNDADGNTIDVADGYPVDHWLKIGALVYVLRSMPAADRLEIEPVGSVVVGERLHAATTIDVRLDSTTPPPIPRDPDFWGPLGFQWIQAV